MSLFSEFTTKNTLSIIKFKAFQAYRNFQKLRFCFLTNMGNASITIHHPTSLHAEYRYLESGKVIHQSAGMIRCEKREGAAVGVGGVFVFNKTI